MGGWQNYTNNNFYTDVAIPLNDEAIKLQNIWLSKKIQNLNTDN